MDLINQQEKIVDRLQRALIDVPDDRLVAGVGSQDGLRDSFNMLAVAIDKLSTLRDAKS